MSDERAEGNAESLRPAKGQSAMASAARALLTRVERAAGAVIDVFALGSGLLVRALISGLAVVGALAALAAYATISFVHLRYPYDIEWMEGGMLDAVRHVLDGGKLYEAPRLAYTPFIYPPGYFWISALASLVLGPSLFTLRLVSVVSSALTCAILFAAVLRETRSRLFALLAPALYVGMYWLGAGFLDLARVDALFVMFVVASAYVLRFHFTRKGQIVAAVLLTAAVYTKQTGAFVAAAFAIWAVVCERRRGLFFAALTVCCIGAAFVALDLHYGGWAYYYLVFIPGQHQLRARALLEFWTVDIGPALALLLVASLGYFSFGERREKRVLAAALAGATIAAWMGRIHTGGWANVEFPLFAMLAWIGPLGLHLAATRLPAPRGRAIALGAACATFGLLGYDPRAVFPTDEDRAAGDEFVRTLEEAKGDVFLPAHGGLLAEAGKRPMAHQMAMSDIFRTRGGMPRAKLRAELLDALERKRFALAVLDTDFFRPDLEATYRHEREVFAEKRVFGTLVGMRTRPRWLYVPK